MKIDVEGAEPGVLKGAEEILRVNKILKIIFECNTEVMVVECRSILERYGYTVKYAGLSYYLAIPNPNSELGVAQ